MVLCLIFVDECGVMKENRDGDVVRRGKGLGWLATIFSITTTREISEIECRV